MTGNRSQLMNFVSKFLGTVRFRNDQIARIMGYGDYQLGNVIISRVYYVEGLGHNLFSVGQFCDADLEVAFQKNTCFIRNLEGVDLLSGSRDTNLYTISLDDMLKSSPICLLSKASKTKSWLWHRRLSHLNFGTLNKLAKDGLARGIPRLKFLKDHLCSAYALGKSKKSSHQPKAEDTNQEKLYLLHMDLCGPMRVASINEKRIMTSITAQQTKLDLELVPKENRLDIGKCNGRIPRGLKPKEETFQVVLDALALTPCYPAFIITADVPEVYMHQFWNCVYKHDNFYRFKIDKKKRFKLTLEVFRDILQICPEAQGQDFDDSLLKKDHFIFLKSILRIWSCSTECLTNPDMKESKAYRELSGYATGVVPPKISRKFRKAFPTKKDSDLVSVDKEPVTKGKRVKRSVKKSTTKPTTGIVVREPPVETKSKGKEKEKVDVSHGKGIELLSEVALSEKAQLKEVRKKSLRDFHKTHPSGSGTVAEKPPSVKKITPTVTSEGTGDKLGVPDVTEDDSTESESESWEQDEEYDDDNQEEEEVDQENKSEDDEIESDEDKGMDDTTDQFDDDWTLQEQVVDDAHVTITTVMKKTEVPATSSSHSSDLASKFLIFLDIPHTDAEIVSPFDVPVQHEVPNTQTTTLLPIHVYVITTIPQSLQTFTPPPLVSTPTPPPTTEATNPPTTLSDFASVFRFNYRITTLEKEVAEIKKDPLHTQESLMEESIAEKDQMPQLLTQGNVLNFAPPVIKKLIKESRDEVTLAKVSSQPQSTYEAAFILTEFELKKILLDKMEISESYLMAPEHEDCYDGLKKYYALDKDFFYSYDVYSLKCGRKDKDKNEDPSAGSDRGLKKRKTSKDAEPTTCQKKKYSMFGSSKDTKSQPKSSGKYVQSEEPVFEVADSDMPQDQEGNMDDNEDEPRKETGSRRDWLKKPTPPYEPTDPDWNIGKTTQEGPSGDYRFDLSKPLPLIKRGNHQRVPFEFFINNDLKYLQGGVSTMTYTTSTTKSKAAKYDLPGIEDMVPNIWSPVKVAYDRYALWGISHWRQQRKSFYAYARGMQSRGDVYSTKHILAVTHVKVMRKHGYRYLEEIVVRRADNVLYRFKEGDFPRLRINDIEDMLILVVQNRLTNLSGDDVADFAIALRMFTRSLVIQKRVEDLQLGVESYQKKINVTKPDTTRPDLRKRHSYTPYKDPQGFIYVDDYKRNRLMRSDELYKFSDGTLTRLLSSLEDITKNIDMEYLPKRRWSTLEKKRAHFMIKDINKLLKERRMMRSLEKFVGGRLYGTDLRLLQRTI
ncbi:retrovirus-related pol polyprotein from transposon TNT 1-94 [Tanacetum coccineum]|uniref:Retrovirus-related pol polyprotein from transposon TNT 1-94 n=1 Tax=Tanacetum coccineum TaxID=301880 RepID=A0ABQ4YSU0_9ASTR